MTDIIIYTKDFCPYCDRAKALLSNKGLTWKEIRIDLEQDKVEEMVTKSGRRSVPQIFINTTHVGGFDDLHLLEQTGKLDALINSQEQ